MNLNGIAAREAWAWTALFVILSMALATMCPASVCVGLPYVVVVMLGIWSFSQSFAYLAAVASTCLVLAEYFMRPHGEAPFWGAEMNRALVIALIWTAALLCFHLRRKLADQERARSAEESASGESQQQTGHSIAGRSQEWIASQDVAFYALAKLAEARDSDTGQHIDRIRAYCHILALELRNDPCFAQVIDARFLADLYRCSPLHDIGKVAVPDALLLKPGRLTPEEYEVVKRHTVIGSGILEDAINRSQGGDLLQMGAVIAKCHHERFDGRGYPAGLSGKAIPLAARIVALADVFDALTSERPYKEAFPPEKACTMIVEQAGRHFDPRVVEAFLKRYEDLLRIQVRYPNRYTHIFGVTESLLAEVCK